MLKTMLTGLYRSGAARLLAPFTQGRGIIFMLHQVKPDMGEAFAPNRILEVTPEFLQAVIEQVQEAGLDIVSLDEAVLRLETGAGNRFACFTFDDGYRDNLEHAYPIFRRLKLPMTIYIPSDFPSGHGQLWWLALEDAVAKNDAVVVKRDGGFWELPTATLDEKWLAYDRFYWWLRSLGEEEQREAVHALAARYGIDMEAMCCRLIMTWDEIKTLAADPLITVGAHTKSHLAIAKLSPEQAMAEMRGGADKIEAEIGARPFHFSFPYGDAESAGSRDFALAREAGFKTAVTTRKGVLFPAHKDHLTALPRVSLNGEYQSLTYTAAYLTGAPFALWNWFRQVDAA